MVLDSPFSCFKTMVEDIVRHQVKIPSCLINGVLSLLNGTIYKKTGVNLKKIQPIKLVKNCETPAFFLVCKDDIISRPDWVKDLYLNYKGKTKEFHLFPGEH